MSYSIYLWHWPLLVFARYVSPERLTGVEVFGIVSLSMLLACGSWAWVERPFRAGANIFTRQHVFRLVGLSAVLLFLSAAVIRQQSWPLAMADEMTLAGGGRDQCVSRAVFEAEELCPVGDPAQASPTFLVWGDSHAFALLPALDVLAQRAHKLGVMASNAGCPPLLGFDRGDIPTHTSTPFACRAFNDQVLQFILARDIQNVMLVARWDLVFGRTEYELANGYAEAFFVDDESSSISLDENFAVFRRGLWRTVQQLNAAGVNVSLLLQAPSLDIQVPRYLAGRHGGEELADIRLQLPQSFEKHEIIKREVSSLASIHDLTVLDPVPSLCNDSGCLIAAGGKPLYFDDDHLTGYGGLQLKNLFLPVIESF